MSVKCTSAKHARLNVFSSDTKAGTFQIGDVQYTAETGYTCTVTVSADKYVTAYSVWIRGGCNHTPNDSTKTITLKYVNGNWTAGDDSRVRFSVYDTYTVTYTDGVDDEEVFVDQTSTVASGKATPAFNGAPTREGYKFTGWSPAVTDTVTGNVTYTAQWEKLETVQLVIYRNGDTSKAYKTVSLESQPKGHVIELTTLDIGDYYTGKYDFSGWYDDGTWNTYKENLANPPAGLEKITVNGWTNIIGMVYDHENVVYFRSAEDLAAYQNDHSKTDGLLYSTTARHGSTLPTATPPTPTREGYRFLYWSREGQSSDVTGQTVNGWTNLYAVWEKTSDEQPQRAAIKKLLKDNIKVKCVSGVDGHTTKAYNTDVGGYSALTMDNADGTHTSTITIGADGYIRQYNEDTGATHVLASGESSSRTIKVVFDSSYETYEVSEGSLPVTFQVVCKDEVVPPTEPTLDELRNLLGQVTVDCTNANANHPDKKYDLIKGSYTANGAEHSGAYICAIGVMANKYVEEYNKDYPGHKLAGSTNFDKVKMVYLTRVKTGTGYGWKLSHTPSEPEALIFKVVCEDVPAETFTVTYTDGVKNKVIFKDDVHENLAYGTATPKFTGGTPKRTGYTFTGWKPKVADTVTGNVTYVAQWKSNSGKDNVPKTGDGEIVMTLSSVLLLSFCGAAAVCVFDRKRKHF